MVINGLIVESIKFPSVSWICFVILSLAIAVNMQCVCVCVSYDGAALFCTLHCLWHQFGQISSQPFG